MRFFFKQKTAYEVRISDWSSDVCSSDLKRHFEGITGKRPGGAEGLVYSRFNGPNQEILEARLGVWEKAEAALVFSSGMSAIATLLLAHVSMNDVIVHSGPLYAATETLIARILPRFVASYVAFLPAASPHPSDANTVSPQCGERQG